MTPRELTVDEAVTFAIVLQQHGRFDEAGELYRRVFADHPDHPRALHYAGVLAHQQHRTGEALELISRSLAFADDQADWQNNLGIVLQEAGRFDEATAAYRRAIALAPDHARAHNNLAVLLRATGHPSDAEAEYRTALTIDPQYIDAHRNLGILLDSLGRTGEAAACYCRAITLRPADADARKLLALAHVTLGEMDRAVEIYQRWLEEEPADPIAAHMLAACTGRDVPSRASDDFVQRTFDRFAASFESRLARLSYRAPALIAAALDDAGLARDGSFDVLDAGCGTGLCGAMLSPYARHLIGVDLSPGMLEHAKEKKRYDELVAGELTEYLQRMPGRFDAVVSADTLVYFGDLREVAVAAAAALRPRGLLAFTVEHCAEDGDAGYRLEPHGRYSHTEGYVTEVLAEAGLECEIARAHLRMEAGAPVQGLVVRARKRRDDR